MVGWRAAGPLGAGRRHGLDGCCASDQPCRPESKRPTLIGHFVVFSTSLDARNPQRRKPTNAVVSGIYQPLALAASTHRHATCRRWQSLAVVFVCPEKIYRWLQVAGGWLYILCSAGGDESCCVALGIFICCQFTDGFPTARCREGRGTWSFGGPARASWMRHSRTVQPGARLMLASNWRAGRRNRKRGAGH
jgi:hypothetical protein